MFKPEYSEKILEISGKLGVPYEWLFSLLRFESNFDPHAKNPESTARGLIQVINDTARRQFGVQDSLALVIRYPDFNSQMDNVVYPYLKAMMPYPTKQNFYMAVFFPLARNVPPWTSFYDLYRNNQSIFGSKWEEKYYAFAKANKGIRKVQDYIDLVDRVVRVGGITFPDPKEHPVLVLGIIMTGILVWKLSRNRKRR
jgi:hypothetical protein